MKSVLIVVDMQNDFLLPDGRLSLGHDTGGLISRVAEKVRGFDGPVILVRDVHEQGDCEFAAFPPHCLAGTPGSEIAAPVLAALEGKIFLKLDKKSYTSHEAAHTIVNTIFRAGAPARVCVTGICTHICVSEVTGDIVNLSKNLHNTVPEISIDTALVDDFDPEMAAFALRRMQSLYGVKVSETVRA
ncbi:MAG: cysteine hydrolase family protein [Elusimicrobiaceae bacterium]|nr:cysteine hydrolase family protein [Elusimicrobiaceae bacterium]